MTGAKPSVISEAIWSRTNETPEWIAASINRFVESFPIVSEDGWQTLDGEAWDTRPDSKEARERIVERNVLSVDGEGFPREGYSLLIVQRGESSTISFTVNAGAVTKGRRSPRHQATVEVTTTDAPRSADLGETAVRALVEAFSPQIASATTLEINELAERGGWKIPAARTLWVDSEISTITNSFDGLDVRPFASGTLVSAPLSWTPEEVVERVVHTLAANGLDEIPH